MEIIARKREELGKKSKSLKYEGFVPCVIFGKGVDSINLTINRNEFTKLYKQTGDTSLIDIAVDGENYKVLVKEVQHDPITGNVIHVGFYKPNLKEKISAQIPVEIINEDKNELIKGGIGMILNLINEIEVEALPMDLPHVFEVDALELKEIDDVITVGELKYDRDKVEIIDLEENTPLVKLAHAEIQEEEKEEVSEEEALAGIEATKEKEVSEEEGEESKGKEEKSKDKDKE